MGFKIRWLVPLLFFQFYLSLTVALYFLGPWPWSESNAWGLLAYLVGGQLFLAIGYLAAWQFLRNGQVKLLVNDRCIESARRFLKIALIVNCALLIPTSLSRTGQPIPDVLSGLANPGEAYNLNFQRLSDGNPFLAVEYLRILFAPLLVGVFPITVVFWNYLGRSIRILSIFVIAFHVGLYLATGTNKGIADFILVFPWLLFLATSAGLMRIKISWRLVGLVFALFFGFLVFFGIGQAQRSGGEAVGAVFNTGNGLIYADQDHWLSSLLPDSGRMVFESITRYVCQGYYALSMAFDVDFDSTLGFGHSMFLARNADAFFVTDRFTTHSLPGELELQTGWGMLSLWHSIYPWLASDVGFAGALLIIGLLGFLFGAIWGGAIRSPRPGGLILLYLLFIIFYYVPANNQVFQSGETFSAFFVCLIVMSLRAVRRRFYQLNTNSYFHL